MAQKETKKKDTIAIRCEGVGTRSLDSLLELQGDLKSLSEKDLTKLKNELVNTGFAFPFQLWREPIEKQKSQAYVIDGHQRIIALKSLRDEGWIIPGLPFVWIDANSKEEALERILQSSSAYGRVTMESLSPFLDLANIRIEQYTERFRLSDLDSGINVQDGEKFDADAFFKDGDGIEPPSEEHEDIILRYEIGEVDDIKRALANIHQTPSVAVKMLLDL